MPSIAVIGVTTDPEFASLLRWIRSRYSSHTIHEYRDISSWEQKATQEIPQLAIVMQAWSNQFSPDDADRLIGATLNTALLCCYGDWCEGDGRTHGIWPFSTRVPVRYARQVIRSELQRLSAGVTGLPPTAARDEVFLARQSTAVPASDANDRTAVVIGADRVYRATVKHFLGSRGWDASDLPLTTSITDIQRPPQLVILDLDPGGEQVHQAIQRLQRRFPDALLFGIASQPATGFRNAEHDIVVYPRLDLLLTITDMESALDSVVA